ncbi:MAG: YigZ family protein [Ruminococcus flavefaciens]|nr:YigZ family protein [Ruminococcus flavefaciens]
MNYFTISQTTETSFIEKRSEFICRIAPVKTNDEAVDFINSVRAEHRKAKHNVYAYILRNDNISRYSDDGEPQGTAGVPVLDVLQKRGLTDVCAVVTRYFGGILLGGGGLVRAYSHAVSLACDEADIMNMCLCHRLKITTDYTMYGKISYILPDFSTITVNSDFGSDVVLEILVLTEKLTPLVKNLTEITNGSVLIEDCGELYQDFSSVKI